MLIGERLKDLRDAKKLSQGHIEKRTGLLRCYISRVENGHTVPSVETLEKLARALEIPVYQLFYDGSDVPQPLKVTSQDQTSWGGNGKGAVYLSKLRKALARISVDDRKLILHMAQKVSSRS